MQATIRPEREEDRAGVHRVNAAAFERPNEADLVEAAPQRNLSI